MRTNKILKNHFNPVSSAVFVLLMAISIGLVATSIINEVIFVATIVASVLIANAIHIADQWEKAVILRMGKYKGLRGAWYFFNHPNH